MEKNEKIYLDVFKSFQYFRLKKSVELIDQVIDANTVNNTDPNPGFFKMIANNYKNNKCYNALEEKNKYETLIRNFEWENQDYNYRLYFERNIEKNIKELFANDYYGLSRLLFAINIIFDKQYEYKGHDETFHLMSSILYYDSSRFNEIEKQFKQLFLSINKKELSRLQKGILIGIGLASITSVVLLPICLVGGATASAVATTTSLSAIGFSDMQIGVGFASLCGAVAGLSLIGIGYGNMRFYNRQKLKTEFKRLSLDESAMLLTIKAMIISEAKKTMPRDKFKEEINKILEIVDDYKSDTEYYLFAERDDVNTNKERINQFHRWDNELIKILNL